MRKFIRSIHHRKVKEINSNHKQIKKIRIAHVFLKTEQYIFELRLLKRGGQHIELRVLLKVSLIMKIFVLIF